MAHKSERRKVNPLSLAFLDVMFCGFGAVILIFIILDHTSTAGDSQAAPELAAEVNLLREEIKEGEDGLVQIRNTLSDVSFEVVQAQGLAREIQEQIDNFLQELAALENSSTATEEDVERLRADVQSLEEELMRLQASAFEQEGNDVRQFLGNGSRQYLSGLFLGGQRILILVDSSASMLDATLVNIIRTRLRSDAAKKAAPKWQRTIKILDWISTQLPITSRYQLYTFSETAVPAISGSEGTWLEVADRDQLNEGVAKVLNTVPGGGTNLEQVFRLVANMSPPPDNIFLITDGLPTTTDRGSRTPLIQPQDRMKLFEEALEELPQGIPVNVILMPLEGDPSAAAVYWQLAQITRGSYISPSKDWPAGSSAVEPEQEPDQGATTDTVDRVEATEQISQDLGVSFPTDI